MLKGIFDVHTISEWMEQRLLPLFEKLDRIQMDAAALRAQKNWPVRPLKFFDKWQNYGLHFENFFNVNETQLITQPWAALTSRISATQKILFSRDLKNYSFYVFESCVNVCTLLFTKLNKCVIPSFTWYLPACLSLYFLNSQLFDMKCRLSPNIHVADSNKLILVPLYYNNKTKRKHCFLDNRSFIIRQLLFFLL